MIEYAMRTPDGAWRIEVITCARSRCYRLVHGDNQRDWLGMAAVQRLLGDAGIDLADFTEAAASPGRVDNTLLC